MLTLNIRQMLRSELRSASALAMKPLVCSGMVWVLSATNCLLHCLHWQRGQVGMGKKVSGMLPRCFTLNLPDPMPCLRNAPTGSHPYI